MTVFTIYIRTQFILSISWQFQLKHR